MFNYIFSHCVFIENGRRRRSANGEGGVPAREKEEKRRRGRRRSIAASTEHRTVKETQLSQSSLALGLANPNKMLSLKTN